MREITKWRKIYRLAEFIEAYDQGADPNKLLKYFPFKKWQIKSWFPYIKWEYQNEDS